MNGEDIIRLSLMGERTMKQRIEWAVNMEREECAKIAEEPWKRHPREIGEAIRARRLSKYLEKDPPFPLMP